MSVSLVSWDYWLNRWPDKAVVLTRANAADGYPRPLTPLSQDLVLTYEEAGVRNFYFETMGALRPGQCARPFMQTYYGLVYLNADQMGDLGEALPGSDRHGMYQSILGLGPDPAYQAPPKSLGEKASEARKALKVGPRMLKMTRSCAARIDAQIADIERRRPPAPDRISEAEAAAWLDRLEEINVDCWETLMIGAGIAIALFDATVKAVTKAIGEDGADLTNRLHVGLGGNESAESGKAVARLATIARAEQGVPLDELRTASHAFATAFDDVLARYGHRAPAELELANPSWRSDPAQLFDIVRMELQRPARQREGADVGDIRREAEAELRRRASAPLRPVVNGLLKKSRELMALRENGKIPIVRVFDETRRLLAAVAPGLVARGVLPEETSICFLRYEELKAVLRGGDGPGLDELVRRQKEHARCLELDLPELVEAGPGWIRPVDDSLLRSWGLLPPVRAEEQESNHRLEGVGASPGTLTGTARVLLDPYGDFEPGDILFAKTVDPGWAPILACAGAVVLDSGGLMSHGAVVSRELGIPCVVNVRNGTALAQSGSTVTVDGSAGAVEL
jgi:pyruvate,water dikinase